MSSTRVGRARVTNWKSVCVVLCCCTQYVEIYTEERAFEDSINFLFSFEENCCWIIPTTSMMWNSKHYWTNMIRKQKNNSPSNWPLVNKLLRIDHERWEIFRRSVDGYHMQKHMWHFARSVQKEVISTSYSYRGWKVDLFWESQAQEIIGEPRRTIHIDCKIELLWQKDDDLCLVGPEGHGLL